MTWFTALAAVVYALDQLSKHYVVAQYRLGERFDLMPLLEFRYLQNRGIAFGLLADKALIVLVASVIVGVLLFVTLLKVQPDDFATATATGLICGGALGNLVDRLRLGYVTDFLHLPHWPTFNVADMGIVAGVTIIIVLQLREVIREARSNRAD